MTNGGRQRVIKWTSLGVYHLGFFIKSKQAKEFRKFMANVANAIDMFKINDKKNEVNSPLSNQNNLDTEYYKNMYYSALERENKLLRELYYSGKNVENERFGKNFLNSEIMKVKELNDEGYSVRQIANVLNRSHNAVHKHIKKLNNKEIL